MFYLQEHLSKVPYGRAGDICLHRVVLAAHYRRLRPVPTPRHIRLNQGNLDHRLDRTALHQRSRLFDLSGKGHGGAQCATGATGTR